MYICYKCKNNLTDENNSVEHIIPDAIGGRLRAKNILCQACNSYFGETIDKELISQVQYKAILIGVKRDRNNNARVVGHKLNGEEVHLGLKAKPFPVMKFNLNSEGKTITFFKPSYLEMKKLAKGKIIEMRKKGIEMNLVEWTELPSAERVFFSNSYSTEIGKIGFGGLGFYQAVAKIAINFYLFKGGIIGYVKHIIDFVSMSSVKNFNVRFFYPSELVHKLLQNEISHLIYLRGDSRKRILYCYIELFSAHNLLVRLNHEYDGPELNEVYCYDLINQVEIKKELFLHITRPLIEEFDMLNLGNPDIHQKLNNRVMNIIELLQKRE